MGNCAENVGSCVDIGMIAGIYLGGVLLGLGGACLFMWLRPDRWYNYRDVSALCLVWPITLFVIVVATAMYALEHACTRLLSRCNEAGLRRAGRKGDVE